ncbi:uncharacterized protein LOC131928173 [Physella acuta]|uniref:uncharacterized protein LOC131928173 n=1 Tax=Physella acuta TaxID=109671 RepID=UPI0027DB92FA|nr:uncharacterized protein LOC131928173 [Physella acuta]
MDTLTVFFRCIIIASILHEAINTRDDAHKDHNRPEKFDPKTEGTTVKQVTERTTAKPVTERTTAKPVTERTTTKLVTERTTAKPVTERTTTKPVETTTCGTNINMQCLPLGTMSKMLCWESFEFAKCAHRIIQSNPCNKGRLWLAQSVLSTLQNGGEFARCGYYLDPKCELGFCFDQTRLDLVPCYDTYIDRPRPNRTPRCEHIDPCLEADRPNLHCRQTMWILSCAADGANYDFCRKYFGRESLTIWRKYQENGDFERCNMGLNPIDNTVGARFPNTRHVTCYNLSGTLTLSYSTNEQQTSHLKGYSWILVVLVIIPFFFTF